MSRNSQTSLIVNELLKYIVVAGMVGSVFVAPNASLLGDKALKFLDKRSRKLKAQSALNYMKQSELIAYEELPDGRTSIKLTEKGKTRELNVRFAELTIPTPKKWDRQWQLVTFDIPERQRNKRSALSLKLRLLGFYQAQRNIWIHPYPCGPEIALVKQIYNIPDNYVILAKVNSINNHDQLAKHFKLHE